MDLETTKTQGSSFANAAGIDALPRVADQESSAMSFESWAAQPAPRKSRSSLNRESIDTGALKIFLILAGLTAGMALGLRLLF